MKLKVRQFVMIFLIAVVSSCGGGSKDESDPVKNPSTFSDMSAQDAFTLDVIDRRGILLSSLGPPDTFSIAVEMIEDNTIITEQWSYFELGVRLDIIDGEISYVMPIEKMLSEVSIYPRFYDPADFNLPMEKSVAIQFLKDQQLSNFSLDEADITDGEMIIGDQIILGFSNDALIYVETLALTPDPDGELQHLYEVEDTDTQAGIPVSSISEVNSSGLYQPQQKSVVESLLPPQVQLVGNFLRLLRFHGQRNKVYREANKVQRDYRAYIEKLKKKAEELAASCRLSTLDRQSNIATLKRVIEKLEIEMQAVNFLTEAEKRNARNRFIRGARAQIIDALSTSGLGNKIVSKLRETAKVDETLADLQKVVDGVLDPGGFQNIITERINKLSRIGQAVGGPIGLRLRLLVSRLQRSIPGVTTAQASATKLQTTINDIQTTLDEIEEAFSGNKTVLSPAYLAGNIEQLFGTLDDPTIDAIAYALAKNMEPGLARNLAVSEGILDPSQFNTMIERVRGTILQGRNEALKERVREACGRPAGEAFLTGTSGIPQKPGVSTKKVSMRADLQSDDPVTAPVCSTFPVDVDELNEDALTALNDKNYQTGIAPNDDMCLAKSTNTPPVAFAKSVTTDQDTAVSFTLNGFDSDNDKLFYDVVTVPSNGQLTGVAPSLTYTPDTEYVGTDSFTFKVDDGKSDSKVVTVNIEVQEKEVKQYYVFKRSGSGYRKLWAGFADSITGYDYFYLHIFPSELEEKKGAYSQFAAATKSACEAGPALCPCPPQPDIWQSGNVEVVGSYDSPDELDNYRCDNFHYGPSNLICNMWTADTDRKYWENINAICN